MARFLRRDRSAAAALAVLILIVLACLLAPVYAARVAGTDPFRSNPDATVVLDGRRLPVVRDNAAGLGLGTTPIGPTWRAAYLLGADEQGRDVAARLLYGGRTSLLIAASAAILCLAVATPLGLLAGYLGGAVDAVLAWLLDLIWAFPVYLLAISLSVVLLSGGMRLGPVAIGSDSLALPVAVLGLVYVPYVARPVRSQAIILRDTEFVLAAVALGGPARHILRRHLLPHVLPTLVVLAPILMAMDLLTEAALSILSIGVQAPAASWGTLIGDGQALIHTRPIVAIAPGLAVMLTVLALNVLGEAARTALDPQGPADGQA